MSRNICKLCLVKESNQTGSHLVTSTLIVSIFTENNKRDYEIIYKSASAGLNKVPYIGRKVLPEKIEKLVGEDYDFMELQSMKNPITADNLFCVECERHFTQIENPFVNIHNNIISKENEELNSIESKENLIIKIYFLLQIWRMSVFDTEPFKCSRKFEEKLRKLIFEITNLKSGDFLENLLKYSNEIKSIPMMVIKTSKHSKNKVLMLNQNLIRPYFAILNDYILLVYEKYKHTKGQKNDLLGVSKFIREDWLNYNESVFTFGFINSKKYIEIKKKYINLQIQQKMNGEIKLFVKAFNNRMGYRPSQIMIVIYIKNLQNCDPRFMFSPENKYRALTASFKIYESMHLL